MALDPGPAALSWDALRGVVQTCTLCGLHEARTQTVFGVGDRGADWLVIGERADAQRKVRVVKLDGSVDRYLDAGTGPAVASPGCRSSARIMSPSRPKAARAARICSSPG